MSKCYRVAVRRIAIIDQYFDIETDQGALVARKLSMDLYLDGEQPVDEDFQYHPNDRITTRVVEVKETGS